MSSAVLVLLLVLKEGSMPLGNGLEFQVRCEEGRLAPPLIGELRAHHVDIKSAEGAGSRTVSRLTLNATDEPRFPRRTRPNPGQPQENAESCFG